MLTGNVPTSTIAVLSNSYLKAIGIAEKKYED